MVGSWTSATSLDAIASAGSENGRWDKPRSEATREPIITARVMP